MPRSVVDPDGRALVALAHSHGGKSTFAAHLVHGGLSLVNDEQTRLLPEHGIVGAFRRPMAIKAGGVEHLPVALPPVVGEPDTRLVPPSVLGARWLGSGRPVLVVVLARDEDHDGPVGVRWLDAIGGGRRLLREQPRPGARSRARAASVRLAGVDRRRRRAHLPVVGRRGSTRSGPAHRGRTPVDPVRGRVGRAGAPTDAGDRPRRDRGGHRRPSDRRRSTSASSSSRPVLRSTIWAVPVATAPGGVDRPTS